MLNQHPEPQDGAGLDFGRVFAQLPTAYMVLDRELVIRNVNDAYQRALSTTSEVIVGKYVFDAFPPPENFQDQDGRHPLLISFERVRDTGVVDQVPLFAFEAPSPTPGGRTHRYFSIVSAPVLDHNGQVSLILQRVEDVTDYIAVQGGEGTPGAPDETAQRQMESIRAELYTRTQELQNALSAQRTASERLAGLAEAALELAGAQNTQDLAETVVNIGLAALGADGGAIAVRDDDRGVADVCMSASLAASAGPEYSQIPLDSPLVHARAASIGQTVLLPHKEAGLAWSPAMAGVYATTGRQAWAILPMVVGDRVLGSLLAAWRDPHAFLPAEVNLLQAFAAQCAQTLDRLQTRATEERITQANRQLSETLQRSLLTAPPAPDHLEIGVRYVPASAATQIGGDWYDAFLVESGDTMLVVGDVAGHDREAAASMAQMRNVLRGVAQHATGTPGEVLTSLDRALTNLQVGSLATAILGHIQQTPEQDQRSERTLRWSNAGHTPPIVVHPDGTAYALDAQPDLLLGFDHTAVRTSHQTRLPAGSTVLLYTDGLIERRGEHLQDGIDRLCRTAQELGHLPVEEFCDQILHRLITEPQDDVALLVLRCHPGDL